MSLFCSTVEGHIHLESILQHVLTYFVHTRAVGHILVYKGFVFIVEGLRYLAADQHVLFQRLFQTYSNLISVSMIIIRVQLK